MPTAPPSARSIARQMTVARDQRSHADAVMVSVIEKAAPQLVAARDLFDRFQTMIRFKAIEVLDDWIEDAASSLLTTFAKGIVADKRAIAAAITEPGQTGKPKDRLQNSR
jgi:transposase